MQHQNPKVILFDTLDRFALAGQNGQDVTLNTAADRHDLNLGLEADQQADPTVSRLQKPKFF